MRAHGRVRPGWSDGVRVRYEPTARDVASVQEGVVLLVRMMFAAGAREVYPGIAGVPEVLRDPAEADMLAGARLRRRDFHLVASHHFGTACAGADPAASVVRPDLRAHDVRGLYVMDASVFPTNLGVNPQHSIMAVTRVAAGRLAAAGTRARAAA
jgi:choline dehydrogenase-like flavoprotein